MQNINKSGILKPKYFVYLLVLIGAYFLGDADLRNLSLKKMGINVPEKINQNVATLTTLNENVSTGAVYKVTYVVDGDTIHVKDLNKPENKDEIVRLLAVNTLEKNSQVAREKCLANMQSVFTKEYLLDKNIYLISDSTQPVRDKYDRLLAYIATTSATTTYYYNDYLIDTGNAKIYRASPPATKYAEYVKKQELAVKNKIGMWNQELCR